MKTDYIADDDNLYTMPGRDFGVFRLLYEDSIGAAYRGLGLDLDADGPPWRRRRRRTRGGLPLPHDQRQVECKRPGRLFGQGRGRRPAPAILQTSPIRRGQGIKHEFAASILDDKIDVNDLGYLRRNDANNYLYRLTWTKSGLDKIRNFSMDPFLRYEVNGEGYRTNNGIATGWNVTLNSLHNIGGFIGWFPQRYDDRNSFGNGTFEVRGRVFSDLSFRTNTSKPLSLFVRAGTRPEYVYGTSIESQVGVTWRPRENLGLELNVRHKDYDGWLLHQEDINFTSFQGTQWQPQLSLDFYPSSRQQSEAGHAMGRHSGSRGSLLRAAGRDDEADRGPQGARRRAG